MSTVSENQDREVHRGELTGDDFQEDSLEGVEIVGSLDRAEEIENRLNTIKDSVVKGDYGTNSWRAPDADFVDSRIEGGDMEGPSLLNRAERTVANAENVETSGALSSSKDSLLIGENMKLTGDEVGILSNGSVIAARNMQLGPTKVENAVGLLTGNSEAHPEDVRTPVITQDEVDIPQAGRFEGDWNELSDYLIEEVPEGTFRPFDLFNVPDQIEDMEHLNEVVEKAQPRYEEVKEKADRVDHRIERLGLEPLEGGVDDLYNRLKGMEVVLDQGEDLNVSAISDPEAEGVNYAITKQHRHDDPEPKKYIGDIQELTSLVNTQDLGDEFMQGLEIVDLEEIEGAEALEYEVKAREIIGSELQEELEFVRRYGDELDIEIAEDNREAYKTLKQIKDNYDLETAREGAELLKKMNETTFTGESPGPSAEVDGGIEEKYRQLANLEEEMKNKLRKRWNLSEEAMEAVEEGNTQYLISNVSEVSDDGKIGKAKKLLGMGGVNQFLTEHKGGNPEKVLEPDFEQEYFLDGENAVEEQEEAVNANYEEGLTLLERLSREQGSFEVTGPEIQEMNEELEQTIEQISSSDGRPPQELIEKKNQLKSRIEEKKREKAFEDLGLEYGEDADFSDLSPLEVRQTLDQMSQEYLENCKAEEEAREIASHIDVSGDVGNGYVKFEMYDKDVTDMPHDDRKVPCSFPGGSMEHEFLGYMQDPGTQIAMLESGDDTGAVISHPVQHEEEDYLLIHSVESDDGITSRQDVSEAVRKHIEDYAEETGMDGVIYSTSSHNSAAEDFIENTVEGDEEYRERTFEVDKQGDEDVYLDFDLPEVQGYKTRI